MCWAEPVLITLISDAASCYGVRLPARSDIGMSAFHVELASRLRLPQLNAWGWVRARVAPQSPHGPIVHQDRSYCLPQYPAHCLCIFKAIHFAPELNAPLETSVRRLHLVDYRTALFISRSDSDGSGPREAAKPLENDRDRNKQCFSP